MFIVTFKMEFCFLFFKQKTAYDMRISDWSSDVCSSDLLLRVDQLLDHAQIDDREVLAEDVVEAALRDAHVERHLAALEAVDRDAAARLLALLAAAGGLALTRADTASDAHPALAGAIVVTKFVKVDRDRKSTRLNSSH